MGSGFLVSMRWAQYLQQQCIFDAIQALVLTHLNCFEGLGLQIQIKNGEQSCMFSKWNSWHETDLIGGQEGTVWVQNLPLKYSIYCKYFLTMCLLSTANTTALFQFWSTLQSLFLSRAHCTKSSLRASHASHSSSHRPDTVCMNNRTSFETDYLNFSQMNLIWTKTIYMFDATTWETCESHGWQYNTGLKARVVDGECWYWSSKE